MATSARKNERRSKKARRRLAAIVIAVVVVAGLIVVIVNATNSSAPVAQGTTAPSTTGDAVQDMAGEADAASIVTATTDDPQILAQLEYVNTYWSDYNDDYGVITDNDCVNFTSQSLLQRGWAMDDEWWSEGPSDAFDYSKPWVSSTAFREIGRAHV